MASDQKHIKDFFAFKVGVSCCTKFLPNENFSQSLLKQYQHLFDWRFKVKAKGFLRFKFLLFEKEDDLHQAVTFRAQKHYFCNDAFLK